MNRKKTRAQRFRWLRIRIMLYFCLIMVGLTVLLTSTVLNWSSKVISKNARNLININSAQIEININSYLKKVERNSALLFSDEDYYKYDASTTSLNEYDKLQRETEIKERIVDLGIMENFSDFTIVYANNSTVGWISNSSKALFDSDSLYEQISAYISDDKTQDGWFSGVNDNFDRLFYVKRLNENAVLLVSFYSREISNVFELPDDLDGMTVQLINEDNYIMYSSNKSEIGMLQNENIGEIASTNGNVTVERNAQLINVRTCENGWWVLCSVPKSILLSDIVALQGYIVSAAIIVLIVFVLIGIILFFQLVKPVDNMFDDLRYKAETDSLSGLYNKKSFETIVNIQMSELSNEDSYSFTILDVDYFKAINDTLGHDCGDQVISRTASFLRDKLPESAVIGRIGGDEFAFYLDTKLQKFQKELDKDFEKDFEKNLENLLIVLQKDFLVEFDEEHKETNTSLSIGTYVKVFDGDTFMDSYRNADTALYTSKNNGRNRYTILKGDESHEK